MKGLRLKENWKSVLINFPLLLAIPITSSCTPTAIPAPTASKSIPQQSQSGGAPAGGSGPIVTKPAATTAPSGSSSGPANALLTAEMPQGESFFD